METLFYYLAIIQIGVGAYLVSQGLLWAAYARLRMRGDPGFNAPRAAVLCSCKGMEPGLEHNLVALTEFDYRYYHAMADSQRPQSRNGAAGRVECFDRDDAQRERKKFLLGRRNGDPPKRLRRNSRVRGMATLG